ASQDRSTRSGASGSRSRGCSDDDHVRALGRDRRQQQAEAVEKYGDLITNGPDLVSFLLVTPEILKVVAPATRLIRFVITGVIATLLAMPTIFIFSLVGGPWFVRSGLARIFHGPQDRMLLCDFVSPIKHLHNAARLTRTGSKTDCLLLISDRALVAR